MKNIIIFVAVYLMSSSSVFAAQNNGSISGAITYCDEGAMAGMQVFIPGKPHVVITGSDGRFLFTNVPTGKHSLNFMLNGKLLNSSKQEQADVSSEGKTSLGLIRVCDEIVKQAGIDKIPVESDGLDCGVAKDGASFFISNGKGECQKGKETLLSCNAGFADCDDKISNGCEINTDNDDEHCGSCFNACSDLSSCNAGLC